MQNSCCENIVFFDDVYFQPKVHLRCQSVRVPGLVVLKGSCISQNNPGANLSSITIYCICSSSRYNLCKWQEPSRQGFPCCEMFVFVIAPYIIVRQHNFYCKCEEFSFLTIYLNNAMNNEKLAVCYLYKAQRNSRRDFFECHGTGLVRFLRENNCEFCFIIFHCTFGFSRLLT